MDIVKLTAEQIQSIVDGAAASLRDSIVQSSKDAIRTRVQFALDGEIASVVQTFFKEHVKAALEAELVKHREEIARQVVTACVSAGEILANRLVERSMKNLGDAYRSDKILEGLFSR